MEKRKRKVKKSWIISSIIMVVVITLIILLYNPVTSIISIKNKGYSLGISYKIYKEGIKEEVLKHDYSQLLETIIDDILHSQLSLSDIAAKYNISRSRVSGINQGTIYKRNVYQYPLRPNDDSRNKSLKKFLDINTIVDIQSDLKTTLSVSSIAKKYGVSTTTIHNINNGKCKKYRLDDVEYPVRKK